MAVVHHLNCATMRPRSERFIHGEGSWLARARMVAHCLLIETEDGLVLVDAGIGLADCADPSRLGGVFVNVVAPLLDPNETAARQIERLGLSRNDVRHIVLTHLDVDHAGGISDFPDAKVHVFAAEHRAAMQPSWRERERYRACHWAHHPKWQLHDVDGETFMGLSAVRAIVEPEVLLVPTAGHSHGHGAVAVKHRDGWLLHCGDAYFHKGEMQKRPYCSAGMAAFQRIVASDNRTRLENQARLREIALNHDDVQVFSAHDRDELHALQHP
jgi:glyoxylase-like metal-dependent hydrolase (beta-lactamase superfamily II)